MLQVRDNIVLRKYEESDAPELFSVIADNRTRLRSYLTWVDTTLKEENSLEFIRSAHQSQHEQKGIAFGIFKEGKLIGGIGMHQWNHTLRRAEIGYWIARAEEGKGIMFDAATVFVNFLFEQLNLNKIEVQFKTENHRSADLAKRLNFKIEGVLRDSLLMHGAFHDIVIAGLLRKEHLRK